MSYGCNDNLYRPQSTRTQHLKKVFTHSAKANLRPEYRARIQLKRVKFGLFSMFRYSPLPLTSDRIFSLGPNWTSWESEDFSIHTAVPTDLLEEVKIFPVQQEAPTDSLEKVLILFRSRGPQLTLFRKCPFSFTHAGSQLTLSRLCSFFSTLQVKTDLKPRTQSEKLIIFVTNRQTDT